MSATHEQLLSKLQDLYWSSAEREICNMLLFYHELQGHTGGDLDPLFPSCETFKKMFYTWIGGQDTWKVKYNTEELFQETIDNARDHYETSSEHRLARYLLQSSSFLDVDILYEETTHNLVKRPALCIERIVLHKNGPRRTGAIRAIRCHGCLCQIRAPIYYECQQNCLSRNAKDDPVALYNDDGDVRLLEQDAASQEQGRTTQSSPHVSANLSPYRLCEECMMLGSPRWGCPSDHYRKIRYRIPQSLDQGLVSRFQDLLGRKSDSKISRALRKERHKFFSKVHEMCSQPAKMASFVVPGASILQHTWSHVAPSGNYHLLVQFGPLLIETGLTGINQGVLVQPRPTPKLFPTMRTNLHLLQNSTNVDETDLVLGCIVIYDDKATGLRHVISRDRKITERRILAHIKRVYGGAFSGYVEAFSNEQIDILGAFVEEARKCRLRRSKSIRAWRKQLHQSAKRISQLLQKIIGNEVTKYLNHISRRLLNPKLKLQFNKATNNCQRLTDNLFVGKNFEYVFPRLPARQADETLASNVPWPRYLIGFGDRVPADWIDIEQPRSVFERFRIRSKPGDDIIDFAHNMMKQATSPGSEEDWVGELSSLTLVTPLSPDEGFVIDYTDGLWYHPRDSLSLLQHHLSRPAYRYLTSDGMNFDHKEWVQGRVRVLAQLDTFATLTGALGKALLRMFTDEPTKVKDLVIPKARIYGTLRAGEAVRIIRGLTGLTNYIVHRIPSKETWHLSGDIAREISHRLSQASSTAKEFDRFRICLTTILDCLKRNAKILKMQRQDVSAWQILASSNMFSLAASINAGVAINLLISIAFEQWNAVSRDNWVYLRLPGNMIWAHQVMRKHKVTRRHMEESECMQKKTLSK